MNKTGLVMRAERNSVSIMTSSGEFFKVEIISKVPKIGDEYTGKLKKENSFLKKLVTAACLLFMVLSGGGVYAYYTPTSSVVININPSIELSANRWNKIIKYLALNKDGETILNAISIKNKSLNEGLNLIVEQSKKDDFINEEYIKASKVISIQISEKNNKGVDLSKFEDYAAKNNLNLKINNNGRETYSNRIINNETLKDKVVDPPNIKKTENQVIKKAENPITKKVEPKDAEIKNMQNNYGKDNKHSPIVKDTKERENQIGIRNDDYDENNYNKNNYLKKNYDSKNYNIKVNERNTR